MAQNLRNNYADDDPEYDTDAATGIDREEVEFEADDPKLVPADLGDSGSAERPGGDD